MFERFRPNCTKSGTAIAELINRVMRDRGFGPLRQ